TKHGKKRSTNYHLLRRVRQRIISHFSLMMIGGEEVVSLKGTACVLGQPVKSPYPGKERR
ncbi:hypothetical protein ATANTOWER_001176, partial [Ataeniobius toweri]|nr:hypothetical protein [Ataeniobius toweri]